MFGFGLTKILFTVAVIVGVWKLFRYLEARGQSQLRGEGDIPKTENPRAVEELVECPNCSTYVPTGGTDPCDRPDCPYRA